MDLFIAADFGLLSERAHGYMLLAWVGISIFSTARTINILRRHDIEGCLSGPLMHTVGSPCLRRRLVTRPDFLNYIIIGRYFLHWGIVLYFLLRDATDPIREALLIILSWLCRVIVSFLGFSEPVGP